jgi:hypothetical protein
MLKGASGREADASMLVRMSRIGFAECDRPADARCEVAPVEVTRFSPSQAARI